MSSLFYRSKAYKPMKIAQTLTAGGNDRSLDQQVVELQPAAVGGDGLDSAGRWPQMAGEIDGTNGAPANLGTSNSGVETEDGYEGRGA